jgi:hypothetical protein
LNAEAVHLKSNFVQTSKTGTEYALECSVSISLDVAARQAPTPSVAPGLSPDRTAKRDVTTMLGLVGYRSNCQGFTSFG